MAQLVGCPEVVLCGYVLVVPFAQEGAADAVEAGAGGSCPCELVLWVGRVREWRDMGVV